MIHLARYFALLLEIYQQIVQVDFYPTIPLFHPHQPQKSTYTRKKVKLKMISGYRFEPTFLWRTSKKRFDQVAEIILSWNLFYKNLFDQKFWSQSEFNLFFNQPS